MCRPICEHVYCIFQGPAHILEGSELFAVAALHWRQQIRHVGGCRDVQEPGRDSFSGRLNRAVEREFALVCPFYV